MDITVIGLILIGVFGIFYVVFTWGSNKKIEKNSNRNVKSGSEKKVASSGTSIKTEKKEVQRKDMFGFMEFDKIVDDMIMNEKQGKYTMVIQCKGINYDLMSEIEQIAVEEGFITFLNTLRNPIQLYVQARAINLKTSLDMYKEKVNEIKQKEYDIQDRLKRLNADINSSDSEIHQTLIEKERYSNITEYAEDITRYVEKLSYNKHMLQRRFYVVISYFKADVMSTTEFTKEEIHDICYRELYTRAQSIIGALQACTVSGRILNSNELAELLYISYNRDDEKLIDIKTALDSGFYRMYSTSKGIQDKKREAMEKQIKQEAMSRVEQAIRLAIDNGIIKSEDEMAEDFEKAADIEAIKILENSDIKQEEKKKIQQIIVDQHNQGVDDRTRKREIEKKENEEKENEENMKKEENKEIEESVKEDIIDIENNTENEDIKIEVNEEKQNNEIEVETIIETNEELNVEKADKDEADDSIV